MAWTLVLTMFLRFKLNETKLISCNIDILILKNTRQRQTDFVTHSSAKLPRQCRPLEKRREPLNLLLRALQSLPRVE